MASLDQPKSGNTYESFDALLAAVILANESSSNIDRQDWLTKHAYFAAELQEYFDALDAVSQRTQFFRQPVRSVAVTEFGKYRLLNPIGRGGMGVVYRAQHVLLDRTVAIKMISRGCDFDLQERRRFQNEAETASMLDHPNIVPVYDFGDNEGQFYLTMKLIEGGTLAEWPDQNNTTNTASGIRQLQRKAATIIAKVARAVHYAHQRGILHRDLKPSNILVDQSGEPYVVDFGLAKNLTTDLDLTQTNLMLGTPSYMAPEQVKSTPSLVSKPPSCQRNVTTATDVYGLGTLLCYLLTGQPPFRGSSMHETLAMVCDAEFPSLRKRNSNLSPDLDAICQKCLQKDPLQRYPSAEALALDLHRWLDDLPTIARPIGSTVRAWRWCQRNKLMATMLSIIGLLVIVSLSSLGAGFLTARKARDEAIHQRQTALKNLRAVLAEINDLENRRPDLEDLRMELLSRIQQQLAPMLSDSIHGTLADETNFWLEIDAGDIHKMQGEFTAAQARFQRALEISEHLPKTATLQRRLKSFALTHLGDMQLRFGENEKALVLTQQALAIRQDLSRSEKTNQAWADEALAHLKLSTALISLGITKANDDFFRSSMDHAQSALVLYSKLVKDEPNNVWHARFVGYGHEMLAESAYYLKRWQESVDYGTRGVESLKQARLRMPQYELVFDQHLGYLLDRQSDCCVRSGQYARCEQSAQESLDIREGLARFNPRVLSISQQPLWSLTYLTISQLRTENFQKAKQSLDHIRRFHDDFLNNPVTAAAISTDIFHSLSRLMDATLPFPEFDSYSLLLSQRRIELLQNMIDQGESSLNADQKFLYHVEFAQLHMLRDELALAQEKLNAAAKWFASSKQLPKRDTAQEMLKAHQALLDGVSSEDRYPKLNHADLLELLQAPCLLVRLRRDLYELKDAEGLVRLSERLWECSDEFYRKQMAVNCLVDAAHLTHANDRKQQIEKLIEQRVNDLSEYPEVARSVLNLRMSSQSSMEYAQTVDAVTPATPGVER